MGCCQHPLKSGNEIIRPQLILENISKSQAFCFIEEDISDIFISYKNMILSKITPEKPLNQSEIEYLFRFSLVKTLDSYSSKFENSPKSLQSDIKKLQVYLISKCQSQEGYFRYLNNSYSLEYTQNTISDILTGFFDGILDKEEATNNYKKLARGSYYLYGLQNLHELLTQDRETAFKTLGEIRDKERQVLEENKKDLERADRKPMLPIEDQYWYREYSQYAPGLPSLKSSCSEKNLRNLLDQDDLE